jgi:phage shock protein E|tara:strand:- start:359 stop:739 length:381 start_codon:yes stop_codon:yes gene_type:complete
MKNWIKITTIVFALFLSATSFAQTPGYHDVQVAEFEKLTKAGKGIILDVRTPKEYTEGHVNGSVNINYFDKNFKDQVGKLDRTKPVYVYCHSGGRSSNAMTVMKSKGFVTVYNLTGGYSAWKNLHK